MQFSLHVAKITVLFLSCFSKGNLFVIQGKTELY